jgi:3-oxoacyl-[acyl-carrier-protein] synthase III
MSRPVYVAGTGAYLPGPPVAFDDIERVLGPLDQAPERIQRWIARTTPVMKELLAVRTFHYALDPVTREFTDDNVSMSVKAARQALGHAGLQPGDVDLLCYGSSHQDQMPTTSVRIQAELGIECCEELGIHANCTSAYKALYLAHQLVRSGQNRCALVLSSNVASSELRAEYYNQARLDRESLFLRWFLCDGAGAVVLTADLARSRGLEVEATYIESVGGKRQSLMFNHRPAYWESPAREYELALHHLRQRFANSLGEGLFQEDGASIFLRGFQRMLRRTPVPLDSIRLFQVNLPTRHIVESVMDEFERLGLARERFYTKLHELGYSGPPMALICLDRILREERLEPGQRVASFVTEVSKFMQAGYLLRAQ